MFYIGYKLFSFRGCKQVLDGWVSESCECVSEDKKNGSPWQEVGADEQKYRNNEQNEVNHRGQVFVAEVGKWYEEV